MCIKYKTPQVFSSFEIKTIIHIHKPITKSSDIIKLALNKFTEDYRSKIEKKEHNLARAYVK